MWFVSYCWVGDGGYVWYENEVIAEHPFLWEQKQEEAPSHVRIRLLWWRKLDAEDLVAAEAADMLPAPEEADDDEAEICEDRG